jgi:hypothetical protein
LIWSSTLIYRHDGYPVNQLRNIATENAKTSHVFLLDADFVPLIDSYEYFLKILANHSRALEVSDHQHHDENVHDICNTQANLALVVPAFETSNQEPKVPLNKSELHQAVRDGHMFVQFMFQGVLVLDPS